MDICGPTWLRHKLNVNDVATFVPTKQNATRVLYSEHNANIRLRLGMSCVGFWTLCATFFLLGLSQWRDADLSLMALIALGGAYVVIQLGFDVLGARINRDMSWAFPDLMRGIFVHAAFIAIFTAATLESYRIGLAPTWMLAVLLPFWFMTRPFVLQLVTGAPLNKQPVAGDLVRTHGSSTPAFTGGSHGLTKKSQTIIPQNWINSAELAPLLAELKRRQWRAERRLALRSMLILTGWNLLGSALAHHLLGLGALDPELATLSHVAAMTLWGFAALLTLPSLSRATVFAADHAASEAGLDVKAWIQRVPEKTGENGSPNSLVQRVFYPVPSTKERLDRLTRKPPSMVFGMLARDNLYLSWPTLSPLGRAVHCNLGEPSLWVYPPDA